MPSGDSGRPDSNSFAFSDTACKLCGERGTVAAPVGDDGPAGTVMAAGAIAMQQREFYARPNRLQKSVWPPTQPLSPGFSGAGGDKGPAPSTPSTSTHASPTAAGVSPPGPKPPTNAGGGSTTNGVMREHASQLSAIREHFFTGNKTVLDFGLILKVMVFFLSFFRMIRSH